MKKVRADFDFTPPALREVSLRVSAVSGINLGQGVCQTPPPTEILSAASEAISQGHNRYAPAQGINELRNAFAKKLRQFNRLDSVADDVLITAGATGAFESVVQAMLEPGDEVILFRPFYPYHRNAILRARGKIKICELNQPNWEFSKEEYLSLFSPRTKLAVICTPNNPTGKVYTKEELTWLGQVNSERGVWSVVDEVYEYLTYDSRSHVSLASLPGMADYTITMGSFSKTFSVTGWRIGYLTAPKAIMPEIRAVSDQLYVCAPTPFQHAVASTLETLPNSYYVQMLESYTKKRELMASMLENAGFEFSLPQGAYYVLASTRKRFPNLTASEVLERMINQCGIGAVPTIDFVGPEGVADRKGDHLLRFCFSVPDEVLAEASQRMARLK